MIDLGQYDAIRSHREYQRALTSEYTYYVYDKHDQLVATCETRWQATKAWRDLDDGYITKKVN